MIAQQTADNVSRSTWSGSTAIMVGLMVATVVFALPNMAWSQTDEWTVYDTTNSGLPYNGVTAIAIDAQGTVWAGTGRWYAFAGGGLAKFDGQNWTVYDTANSWLPNNDHIDLCIDPQGNVWSATESGLSRFDGQNWTVYTTDNSGLPYNQMGCAPVFDAEGNAWIGTFGGGLVKFDGENWTVFNTGNSGLPNNMVWPIAFDAQGTLWIGTFGGGLAKFDGANWKAYNTGNSALPDDTIACLSVDVQGNVWIGTHNNGLAKFDGTNWTAYNTANSGLPHNRIWNLAITPEGNIWAATGGGLAKFDGKNWTVYNKSNSGLPDNIVYSLAFDAQGNLWIGTESGGLAVFRPRPIVDFNGNGIVDIKDLLRLIESWGENDPLCDIGPTAFGDGIVDAADLEVLMSYWGQEVQDSTLVAHWKLDETSGTIASDSARDHDGILIGLPAWQPDSGAVGGALECNGTTFLVADFVLNPSNGPFSVFAWVKGGAPGQTIISQQTGANWLLLAPATGVLITELAKSARGVGLSSPAVITDGDWHRVGFTWDGAYRRLYVDDVLVAEDAQDRLTDAYGKQIIGTAKNMAPGTFWSGPLDDLRIYNRAVSP